MTDPDRLIQPDQGQPARTIHIVDAGHYPDWLNGQSERVRAMLDAVRFAPKPYAHAIIPGDAPGDWSVVTNVADRNDLSSWCLAKLADVLPEGCYRLASGDPGPAPFGWITGQYRFGAYKAEDPPRGPRILLTPNAAGIAAPVAEARAVMRVRDMVNTPAEDMGPARLESIAGDIAGAHGATLTVTRGDRLEQEYPMIHAVGRAADRTHAPRLIEIAWGRDDHPAVAIIGKGVCFDSGGLDIKPAAGMLLMKKDMGGAAHALALAELIMAARLPVRLHCLVPAVENAISGGAFRPGDVLRSRAGKTVEITNTDAEGRLVLADALTRAVEGKPQLIVDFATLTGAARVALGPDLPALFVNRDELGDAVLAAGKARDDQLWRMPLWTGYDEMLKSDIADLVNATSSPFAGAVTAALFLRNFVPADIEWAHLDTFAWRPAAKPGRPKGGDALGLRAVWGMLESRYGG